MPRQVWDQGVKMIPATPNNDETERLLRQAQIEGGREAFESLFARHREYLKKVVAMRLDRRMQSRLDPSDVVQQAQLDAFRRFDDYLERRPMPFRLWLRRTACEHLYMMQRFHRAHRRDVGREVGIPEQSAVALVEQLIGRGSAPNGRLERSETARCIRQILMQLSDADREILLMRNLEALSNQETAEALEIEPATASQRYGRALIRLRKLLLSSGMIGSQA